MSTGTDVVTSALQDIGVYSALQPANPESLETGRVTLNSMLSTWEDDNIKLGTVPLETIGSELSEPSGARIGIETNLALALAPKFPGAQISIELRRQAYREYQTILNLWQEKSIPKRKVRSTLMKGQGNKRYGNTRWEYVYFPKGSTIG